jgi:hypothetical protein
MIWNYLRFVRLAISRGNDCQTHCIHAGTPWLTRSGPLAEALLQPCDAIGRVPEYYGALLIDT